MRFNIILLTITVIVCISYISGCGREFNNPADPANNGGFYGGVDPKITGTWDEIIYNINGVPSVDLKALVCQTNSFVLRTWNIGANGFVNAHKGKVFVYYSNNLDPTYFLDYSLDVTGDTLYMAENRSSAYNDPLTVHGYDVFVRSR